MGNEMNRRDLLKTMGLLSMGGAVAPLLGEGRTGKPVLFQSNPMHSTPDKPVSFIVLGAGNRGNVYAGYAEKYPDEMKIVGVAEPIPIRIQRFSELYDIPKDKQFVTWEHVFNRPKFADAVVVSTPDHLHHGPAMQAMAMGYDVLLEKPVAQTWKECRDILLQSKKYDRIVAVCHVLRYTPYFRKMKEELESGALGEIVSVEHLEPIQHIHMTHSYVRGIWRREDETNPAILAKSCHDLDILRWMIDKPCRLISSFGSLKWFRKENAPEGAPARCTDGCPVESDCPYSALKIYYRKRTWLSHFDLPDNPDEHGPVIMDQLKTGPMGRCVYHCDNDVVDHQIVSMEFEDAVTANFNMEAFTHYHGRRTRIFGSMGDLFGDMDDLYVADFKTGDIRHWNVKEHAVVESGHGGGDYGLVRDLIQAISQRKPELLTSTIDASMESHLMGFMAEESRKKRKIMEVKMDV